MSRKRGFKTGKYRSRFESDVLSKLVNNGTLEYESVKLKYTMEHTYTPDGVYKKGNMYIEVKGVFTAADRTKSLEVRKQHPGIDIRFVFQDPWKPLRKGSQTTYATWCDKHGFLWSDGYVPKDWLV